MFLCTGLKLIFDHARSVFCKDILCDKTPWSVFCKKKLTKIKECHSNVLILYDLMYSV